MILVFFIYHKSKLPSLINKPKSPIAAIQQTIDINKMILILLNLFLIIKLEELLEYL